MNSSIVIRRLSNDNQYTTRSEIIEDWQGAQYSLFAALGASAMKKQLANVALIVGTLVLMVIGGFTAFSWALGVLMGMGTKYHNIYDYYGYTYPWLSIPFMLGSIAVGFIAPAVIVWHLQKNSWRVSLRTLFIAMTVIALLVASYTYFNVM